MKYKAILILLALTSCSHPGQEVPDGSIARQTDDNEILAGDFTDMQYLFLIQEEVGRFDDAGTPWYEYALLGGSYDTYEKGVNCYEDVNRQFTIYWNSYVYPLTPSLTTGWFISQRQLNGIRRQLIFWMIS